MSNLNQHFSQPSTRDVFPNADDSNLNLNQGPAHAAYYVPGPTAVDLVRSRLSYAQHLGLAFTFREVGLTNRVNADGQRSVGLVFSFQVTVSTLAGIAAGFFLGRKLFLAFGPK